MIDVAAGLSGAPGEDTLARTSVVHRAAHTLRPVGSLRRLDEIAAWLAAWQRTDTPSVEDPGLLIAAADHGVAGCGVSALPPQATVAMLDAIRAGAATSTVLAASLGASVRLLDVGAGRPTEDITVTDAMPFERFWAAFDVGREAVASMGVDLLMVGDIGVGSTTAASAVSLALFGGEIAEWVGTGSGIDSAALERKLEAVATAVARVRPVGPLEALRRLGGPEMAAVAGAVYQARLDSIPVLLDGFVSVAAVAPLALLVPGSLDHAMASHRSTEPGHARLLTELAKPPIVDLGIGLGEGSGALLALPVVRAAALAVSDVTTFDEWGLR
jgi:nicotinate-nucleotide--dimethylbenzimidazole phosphoribosyltransferase